MGGEDRARGAGKEWAMAWAQDSDRSSQEHRPCAYH